MPKLFAWGPHCRGKLKQCLFIVLLFIPSLLWECPDAVSQQGPISMSKIELNPVGRVEHRDGKIFVVVLPAYTAALEGIEGFSQIWVIYWFHGNDNPEKRGTLEVHPRRNPANPLTGVFATRSPARPNLLGMQACRLVKREGTRLEVEGLDAWDGSPVLDIKPYLPQLDSHPQAAIPKWAEGRPPE
jgi:tRNA (adenine37-N6)-methyltransferase